MLLLLPQFGVAQINYHLQLNTDTEIEFLTEQYASISGDSLAILKAAQNIKEQLWKNGYLAAEGSLNFADSTATLNIHVNKKYSFNTLSIKWQDSSGIARPALFFDTEYFKNYDKVLGYQKKLINTLENNGYPFAQTSITEIEMKNDTVLAQINIDEGPYISIDSLVVKGYTKFSENVLRYFLNYTKGMPYSEEYIQKLPNLINQVEYLKFTAAPAVAFTENKTILFLYIDEIKSNQVDGVVGLNTTPEGETTINGDFQLRLLNIFKRGEEVEVRWRRPDESVQSLNVAVTFPFLFKTPFWFASNLQIFRQDSSFVNTSAEGLLKYYLGGGSLLTGGIGYKASNALQDDNSGFGSFTTTQYKLGVELFKTDRILIPRSGYILKTFGFTAQRITNENRLPQYGWQVIAENYWRIKQNNVIVTKLNSESLFGDNLFTNEVYRVGGLKTLRGFNEQQIFTSSYAIGTLEYRYLLGDYDYITVFYDVAFAENTANNTYTSNVYTGLGTGFSFRTNAGIFSLFYAMGRDLQNPFDFRTSKIHFGYVSQF